MKQTYKGSCKKCGARLGDFNTEASTGERHYCEPKVKVYSKEEIEKMNEERNVKSN